MSNNYRPHVHVIPEDDANRQIVVGFMERLPRSRQLQLRPNTRGWAAARDMLPDLCKELREHPLRILVVLVDFDGQADRRQQFLDEVDAAVRPRLFVLGVLSEPERLKRDLGSYESIGRTLADECTDGTGAAWTLALLAHNAAEASRLLAATRPILFEPS